MSTHILIPIEKINNRRELLKKMIRATTHQQLKSAYDTELNCLNGILGYKQISLDEKDIYEKSYTSTRNGIKDAEKVMKKMGEPITASDKTFWMAGSIRGYKQALKDLL